MVVTFIYINLWFCLAFSKLISTLKKREKNKCFTIVGEDVLGLED